MTTSTTTTTIAPTSGTEMGARGRAAALGGALTLLIVLIVFGSARAGEPGPRRTLPRHSHASGLAGQRAHVSPTIGPAGPPPLGAAGPPPLGAAGPPPLGAAGPPPLGVATGGVFAEDPLPRLRRHRHRTAVPCCFDDPAGAPVDVEAAPARPTLEGSDPLD